MLTTTETDWLITQQSKLVDASAKADAYGDSLAVLHATPEPSGWNLLAWRQRRREHEGLLAQWAMWTATTNRRTGVINAWMEVHHATTGQKRGPVAVADNGSRLTTR